MALCPAIAVDGPASAPPVSAPTRPPPVPLVPSLGKAAATKPVVTPAHHARRRRRGAPAEEAAATKPAVTPTPTAAPEPPLDAIDVFISYCHDDKQWVVEELEPFLTQNGCSVCRDDQIPPGADFQQWLCDRIAASRHVLVVLTKASVKSRWVRLELEMVSDEDPDGRKSKLVPILREACDLPAFLVPGHIQRIDLTVHNPDERERQMVSLLKAVRRTGSQGGPVIGTKDLEVARVTPRDLRSKFSEVRSQKKVADFQAKISRACELLEKIEHFKKLHDGLHKLIDRCQMVGREIKRLSGDDAAWEDLEREGLKLANDLENLVSTAQESPVRSDVGEVWIRALDTARSLLEEAVWQHDKDKLTFEMTIINEKRDQKFNRVNARLFGAADELKFDELLASVEGVLEVFKSLEPSRMDERAARRCDEIYRPYLALQEVGPRWVALINNHNLHQQVHEMLTQIKDEQLADPSSFQILYWDEVTDALGKLTPVSDDARHDAQRKAKLEALRASAAAVSQAVVTEGNRDKGSKALEGFQTLHGLYFIKTDTDLKSLCPKMVSIGNDLKISLEHLSDVD